MDENRHLPSPLCEKFEISKDLSLFSKPAVLPAYMSAWELDVTNGSVRDYSLELVSIHGIVNTFTANILKASALLSEASNANSMDLDETAP